MPLRPVNGRILIGRVTACNTADGLRHRQSDRLSVYRVCVAVVGRDCLAWAIGILRRGQWRELVQVVPRGQMSPKAAYVCYLQHRVAWQLSLDRQIVLLHIRPDSVGWNGEYLQRELQTEFRRRCCIR